MFVREVRLRAALLLVTWSVGTALSFTRKLPGRFFFSFFFGLQKRFFLVFAQRFFTFSHFGAATLFLVFKYVFF